MNDGLKLIKSLTWEDVFEIWRQNEEHLTHWKAHYESRGFSSWKDWRMSSAERLKPQTLAWELFEIVDPTASVRTFRGGPFNGWIKNIYNGTEMPRFSEIIRSETIRETITKSHFIENFPAETTISALKVGEDVIVIEGMHRCTAIAMAAEQGRPVQTRLFVALATYPYGDLPLLGHPESST